ncbi:MAG: hypothetical protein CMO34_00700 [Verrucomicrobia bacterium]|nr:hypothetical protein [Verrucomicrobiota bacterium]
MENINTFPELFPRLETQRLFLENFNTHVAEEFYRIRSNETFMLYMGTYPMSMVKEAEDHIQMLLDTYERKEGIAWKVVEKETLQLIGYIGFFDLDGHHARAEIGFGIALEHQRKGYGAEALKAAINFCFEELGLHSLMAEIDPRNTACIKLVEKCGFVREGLFKENFYFDGKFLDSAYYCILHQTP